MRRLDSHDRLDVVASQQHGVLDRTAVSADEAKYAVWTVDGSVKVGGARAVGLALAVGRDARWPLIAWRLPLRVFGAPWLLDRIYELVAANRHRIPGDTPWCRDHQGACKPPPD